MSNLRSNIPEKKSAIQQTDLIILDSLEKGTYVTEFKNVILDQNNFGTVPVEVYRADIANTANYINKTTNEKLNEFDTPEILALFYDVHSNGQSKLIGIRGHNETDIPFIRHVDTIDPVNLTLGLPISKKATTGKDISTELSNADILLSPGAYRVECNGTFTLVGPPGGIDQNGEVFGNGDRAYVTLELYRDSQPNEILLYSTPAADQVIGPSQSGGRPFNSKYTSQTCYMYGYISVCKPSIIRLRAKTAGEYVIGSIDPNNLGDFPDTFTNPVQLIFEKVCKDPFCFEIASAENDPIIGFDIFTTTTIPPETNPPTLPPRRTTTTGTPTSRPGTTTFRPRTTTFRPRTLPPIPPPPNTPRPPGGGGPPGGGKGTSTTIRPTVGGGGGRPRPNRRKKPEINCRKAGWCGESWPIWSLYPEGAFEVDQFNYGRQIQPSAPTAPNIYGYKSSSMEYSGRTELGWCYTERLGGRIRRGQCFREELILEGTGSLQLFPQLYCNKCADPPRHPAGIFTFPPAACPGFFAVDGYLTPADFRGDYPLADQIQEDIQETGGRVRVLSTFSPGVFTHGYPFHARGLCTATATMPCYVKSHGQGQIAEDNDPEYSPDKAIARALSDAGVGAVGAFDPNSFSRDGSASSSRDNPAIIALATQLFKAPIQTSSQIVQNAKSYISNIIFRETPPSFAKNALVEEYYNNLTDTAILGLGKLESIAGVPTEDLERFLAGITALALHIFNDWLEIAAPTTAGGYNIINISGPGMLEILTYRIYDMDGAQELQQFKDAAAGGLYGRLRAIGNNNLQLLMDDLIEVRGNADYYAFHEKVNSRAGARDAKALLEHWRNEGVGREKFVGRPLAWWKSTMLYDILRDEEADDALKAGGTYNTVIATQGECCMSKEDMIIEAFYWNRSLTAKDYDGNPAPWYADRRLVIEGAEPAVIDPRTGYPIVGLDKPAKIALVPTWKNIEEWQKQTVNIAAIIASAVPNAPTAEGYIDSKGKYVPGCNG